MILGIVSNCWRKQLEDGEELETLIAEAQRRGFGAIELRQTCLGRHETSEHLPRPETLAELPHQFPDVRFNIAICAAFMDPALTPDDPVFSAAKLAARAVAGGALPHLRLVDLVTQGERLHQATASSAAQTIGRLAQAMFEIDGVLDVENSKQPWTLFYEAFASARRNLGSQAARLRICFDPCNLLVPDDGSDPYQVTASLSPDEVSLIHFKQRRDGHIFPAVADGDVDWPALVPLINEKNFTCPGLLEIDPHKRVWGYLAGSRKYLQRLGLEIKDLHHDDNSK